MASGRIEQQIDLKVTGLQDVKAAEKIVDGLDGTKAKVTVEADATKAQRTVKDVLEDVKKLDKQDAQIVLSLRAAAVEQELTDILQDVAKVDGDKATIDVELARATELRADLDQLGSAIKELDDTKVEVEVDIDTEKARTGFEDVGKSADQAKSVSANAIGNMTQDFGELGGVAGSAGVAIGQFGEYFADAMAAGEEGIGSIAKNFLTMAGPLTAATIGVGILLDTFQKFQAAAAETKAFRTERVDAFVDALGDARVSVEELEKVLETGGKGKGIFIRVADETKNADLSVGKLFGTLENFNKAIAKGQPGYDEWAAGLIKTAEASHASREDIDQLKLVLDDARDGATNAGMAAVAYSEHLTTVQQAAIAYASAIKDSGVALNRAGFEARFYAKETDEAAKKSEGSGQTFLSWTANVLKAQLAAQKYAETVSSIDWRASGLEGGIAGMSAFREQFFDLTDIAASFEASLDNLGQSLKDNGKTFDLNTEKGRANQAAIEDLAASLDTQLAAAYKDSNGDAAAFQAKAEGIADTLKTRLQKELGLSGKQADDMIRRLGLMPEDIETRYTLSGTEEAKLKLQLLDDQITRLPKDVQATITQQILVGDYTGAVATVQGYFNAHPGHIQTKTDNPDNTAQVLSEAQQYFNRHPLQIKANFTGGPQLAAAEGTPSAPWPGALAGEAGPEYVKVPGQQERLLVGPAWVPPGTRVTSTKRTRAILARGGHMRMYANGGTVPMPPPVTVNLRLQAGVIGSRFEVERAVRRATRDGIRLAGTR